MIHHFREFSAHGWCFLWQPDMIAWHTISDAFIALSYLAISLSLLSFRRYIAREQQLSRWAFASFATFITACGLTHVMDIVVIWQPAYMLQGAVKSVCAVASVSTAVILAGLLRDFVRGRRSLKIG